MPALDMPCLHRDGLAVFTQTPEQRLILGAEWFTATHVPMRLRQYIRGKPKSISEEEVLSTFQPIKRHVGNHVIILYGAAGSGKSELMAWIEERIKLEDSLRPVVRITRTELDIFSVINKLRYLLTGDYFDHTTVQRWATMRRKPRTLAKLLVLHALERLLDSDDVINALFYRLMDIVEPQISRILNATTGTEALDIIQRDDYDSLEAAAGVSLPFEFERFRQYMLDGFREMMLENINIRDTLTSLSQHFGQHGQRPMIIIDDLVQSVNLFATEFLDYFITLDQGNWDVIIGITPASFQSDARGRGLIERINHLDTIDDRVTKLWLSDEQGLESFFLTEANCVDLAYAYLDAFRHLNHVDCRHCPALERCQMLRHRDAHLLAPLNEAAIVRLFRSLPIGKGKVRALISTLREVLESIIEGGSPNESLSVLGYSELAVECDTNGGDLLKWYVSPQALNHTAHILDFFGIRQPTRVQITPMDMIDSETVPDSLDDTDAEQEQYSRVAVRDWLEGKPVNRQLLQKLRKGVVIWLRAVQLPIALATFHHPHVARPNKILRDGLMEMDTTPPITLEGVDDFTGINVSPSMGHLAFKFVTLSESNGSVQQVINRKIAKDPRVLTLLWQVQTYAEQRRNMLESELGMPLERFALVVYLLRLLLNGLPPLYPPSFAPALDEQIQAMHTHMRYFIAPLPSQMTASIDKLFDDFFKLRDNVYDTPRLMAITERIAVEDSLHFISGILPEAVDNAFLLGNIPLRDVIQRLQARTVVALKALHSQSPSYIQLLSPQGREILERLQQGSGVPLGALTPKSWHDFHEQTPEFYQRMRVYLTQQTD